MAETGFKYFIEFMQARNAPPKPKRTRCPAITASAPYQPPPPNDDCAGISSGDAHLAGHDKLPTVTQPGEDYTGSVCLLHKLTPKTPAYEEVLLDIEDFERLKDRSWRIDRWGRNKAKYAVSKNAVQIGALITNSPKGKVVDHIRSSRTLDNRRSNLRVTTQGKHQVNTRRQKNGTSQYKGVQLCPKTGRWRVQCGRRNARVFLGVFTDEVEAARVYNEYAKREYGEFACLNLV
jgi:hypothetical protein